MRRPSVRFAGILLAGGALALSGCTSGSGDSGSSAGGGEGTLGVVASTNVYGNILETVGGDHVTVSSIIDRPSQDPHSYEATARDKLAVSEADLVVLNGGGYDTFMETLVADSGIDSADVLNAVEISGLEEAGGETHNDDDGASETADGGDDHAGDHGGHSHGSFNEHVWYSPEAMGLLAEAAAERLSTLDPDHASDYRDNAATFNSGIEELTADLAEDKTAAGGRDVALTEPVPEYLFDAAGLHNATPADFTSAVEEGADVPPAVLKEMQDLLRSGEIAFLAYNTQTSTAQTESVRTTAEDAGVPVLDFSETLPEGQDYLAWMGANVTAIDDVLR